MVERRRPSMAESRFPNSDDDFEDVALNLKSFVQDEGAQKGLTPADQAQVAAMVDLFATKLIKHKESRLIALEDSAAKDMARSECQGTLSHVVDLMGPRLSNAERPAPGPR